MTFKNTNLHGIVQFLFFPILHDSFLLLLHHFLCLEVSGCTVLHCIVSVLRVGLWSQHATGGVRN